MPWIDKTSCTGCGICISECPVDAITLSNDQAEIDMSECIHCGVCHDVCPQDSIRHDSEKKADMIKANIKITKKYMDLCTQLLGDLNGAEKCRRRMIKHFTNEKIIAEKTIEELEKLA